MITKITWNDINGAMFVTVSPFFYIYIQRDCLGCRDREVEDVGGSRGLTNISKVVVTYALACVWPDEAFLPSVHFYLTCQWVVHGWSCWTCIPCTRKRQTSIHLSVDPGTQFTADAWLLKITDFHPWPWKFRLCFSCMFMLTFLHSFLARTLGKKQVGVGLDTHDVSALISSSLTTCMRGRIGHAWRTAWSTETTDDEMCVRARARLCLLWSGTVD